MHPRGHAGTTLLAFTPLLFVHNSPIAIAPFVITAVLFSLAPDIDVCDAPLLSRLSHRGLTHTLWFVLGVFGFTTAGLLLLATAAGLTMKVGLMIGLAATFGAGLHLAVDITNMDKGLPLLTPVVKTEFHLPVAPSTTAINNAMFMLGVGLTFLLYA